MSLTLLLICLCVVALMIVAQRGKMYNYSCSQCGSRNGKHADHCSFKKFDDH